MPDLDGQRVVVVDGSNLATEGRTLPSLKQLDEAVQAYAAEDPGAEIVVVVDASFEHRIDPSEAEQLVQAELHGEIVSPPAGAIGRGDAFVLRIAERAGARVLSNDSFQEFHAEHPWLFDEGRLVGGKPVPGIGWIFTPRIPVRGPKSRAVTGKAARRALAGDGLTPPVKAAELARAAKKVAARRAPVMPDGSAPKVGDVWPPVRVGRNGVGGGGAGVGAGTGIGAGNGSGAGAAAGVEFENGASLVPDGEAVPGGASAQRGRAGAPRLRASDRDKGDPKEKAKQPKKSKEAASAAGVRKSPAKKAAVVATAAAGVASAPAKKAASAEKSGGAKKAGAKKSVATKAAAKKASPAKTATEKTAPAKKVAAKKAARAVTSGAADAAIASAGKAPAEKAATAAKVTKKTVAKKAPSSEKAAAAKKSSVAKAVAGTKQVAATKKAAPTKQGAMARKGAPAKQTAAATAISETAGSETANFENASSETATVASASKRGSATRRRAAQVGASTSADVSSGLAVNDPPAPTAAAVAKRARVAKKSAETADRAAQAAKARLQDPAARDAIDLAMAEAMAPLPRQPRASAEPNEARARKPKGAAKGSKRRRRRSADPPPAVNEPLAFITFVAAYPLQSEVEGEVVSFTSHGAMVDVDLPGGGILHCYVPLSGMGDPPPTKARQVLARGERRPFVLVALDPPRRVAELALLGV